jgi:hypothetical protein
VNHPTRRISVFPDHIHYILLSFRSYSLLFFIVIMDLSINLDTLQNRAWNGSIVMNPTSAIFIFVFRCLFISCLPYFEASAASAPYIPSPNADIDTAPVNKAIIIVKIFFIHCQLAIFVISVLLSF